MLDLNLNPFLQSKDSPLLSDEYTSGYEFDSSLERSSINTSHIRNFSFNSGQGGTLTLGGSGNGNGVLSVENAGGTEKVRADSDGLTITDGKINIQNTAGSASFDGSGVVSEQNFIDSSAELTGGGTQETSSYSPVDVTGGSLSFITTRNRIVNVNCMTSFWVFSGATYGTNNYRGFSKFAFDIDGTLSSYQPQNEAGYIDSGGTNSRAYGAYGLSNTSFNSVFNLGAGTHTLKIQALLDQLELASGTPVLRIFAFRLNYTLLGT